MEFIHLVGWDTTSYFLFRPDIVRNVCLINAFRAKNTVTLQPEDECPVLRTSQKTKH